MRSMRSRKRLALRIAMVFFAFVFCISSAVLCLEMWEKNRGGFSRLEEESLVFSYQGKDYVPKDQIETFLVLGLDQCEEKGATESYYNDQQADFLMLFVFDHKEKTVQALHINRDTMVDVNILGVAGQSIGTEFSQIALAHIYGNGKDVSCRNVSDSVSRLLLESKINHYLSLKLDAVPSINDALGGVELEILDDFSAVDQSLVKGEKVLLKGEQALTYIRSRKGVDDGSNLSRMTRQRQYINGVYDAFREKVKQEENFSQSLILEISEYLISDRSVTQLQELAKKFEAYEFLGIKEIKGEAKEGEKFMEFYPDKEELQKLVVDLFYQEKK